MSHENFDRLQRLRETGRPLLDDLRREGRAESDPARVRSPPGLDLGARTPERIALAVAAEIVLVRRGAGGRPLAEPAPTGPPHPGAGAVVRAASAAVPTREATAGAAPAALPPRRRYH
jgi:xanthine dehydrogenase accessory factor